MLEIPGLEWSSINGDDGVLNKSLGSSELIVSGIVGGVDDSGLSGDALGLPGKVAVVD